MISERDILKARDVDLLSFLRTNDPGQLVHISRDNYCTRDHDSLKINNGKWFWFSRGIGGVSALDYLVKVQGMPFQEAVEFLLCNTYGSVPAHKDEITVRERVLKLPEKNRSNDVIIRYLLKRGLDLGIIRKCINEGILYESAKYHNAVFIGKDEKGIPRYAALRGTKDGFKGEATGSDKEYAFSISTENAERIHVFESPIDLLSYLTLLDLFGIDRTQDAFISLGGVNASGIYKQLNRMLDGGLYKQVFLHLDNDDAGRNAAIAISTALTGQYDVYDCPPRYGKDVNDCLQKYREDMKREVKNAR